MRRIACFPYAGEADMLECHLTEVADVIDYFVIVEADVTHGGNRPKPYLFLEQQERFEAWSDQIVYVQASGLPDLEDAWSRELAQREWCWKGLERLNADPDDIVLHGDVDEIPTSLAAQMVRPRGFVVFEQRAHPFAVDWLHPKPWRGTVVGRVEDIGTFAAMRDVRLRSSNVLPESGWHFSWVSDGLESKIDKMRSFCHTEIAGVWEGRLDACWETGIHVDGAHLQPVEVVEGEWPRWITDGHAPESWYRPRSSNRPRPHMKIPHLVGPKT